MRIGETIDPNAGLNKPDLYSEDDLETNAAEANKNLLEGFQMPTSSEELQKQYDEMFEGIETAELEFFKNLIDDAPAEVQQALESGDTGPLVAHANKLGVIGKRLVGLVVFAAISFAAMSFNVGSASAADGGIEKAKMFSPGSDQAKIERANIGGGGVKPLKGGGKIMIDNARTDFDKKVSAWNDSQSSGTTVDGQGNQNLEGGISVDGRRI